MFFKKKSSIKVESEPKTEVIKVEPLESSELDALKQQVTDQKQIIRELLKLVVMISEHKNYAFIQRQRDLINNLLDKNTKV